MRRRITLQIDRINAPGGRIDGRALAAAIGARLGVLVQREGAALAPASGAVAVVDGGTADQGAAHGAMGGGATSDGRAASEAVGRAVAQATMGVLKR